MRWASPCVLAAMLAGIPITRAAVPEGACARRGTSVVVLLDEHLLLLCRSSAVEGVYPVALGKNGVGKRTVNDGRTPVGAYALGAPRLSRRFGTFIPIDYPTSEQKMRGYSGGGIGVHGPDRRFSWAGRATTLIDWTRGCVAVSSDEAIGEIASWVIRERAGIVYLEGASPMATAATEGEARGRGRDDAAGVRREQ